MADVSKKKLEISPLTALPDGRFAIYIGDDVFGYISAHPKAAFSVVDKEGRTVRTFPAGTHTHTYKGVDVSIVVKDLNLRFLPEFPEKNTRHGWSEGMEKAYPDTKSHAAHNKKAMEELMSRVVVTEV